MTHARKLPGAERLGHHSWRWGNWTLYLRRFRKGYGDRPIWVVRNVGGFWMAQTSGRHTVKILSVLGPEIRRPPEGIRNEDC